MERTAIALTAALFAGVAASPRAHGASGKSAPAPEIMVKSTLDGTMRPSYFYVPASKSGERIPLLVALHTWSYGYKSKSPLDWALKECRARGWAMLYPDFRGPNWTPQACGSDLAVQDILDAVEYAKANAPIDADRIYVMGGSGGGMMALLLAGRAPGVWAGVYSGCPITDIARWHADSKRIRTGYWKHMEKACGGVPDVRADEYRKRSPLTWLAAARKAKVHVQICTGMHDGHRRKGGGSVPIGHAVRGFNVLADEKDRISEDAIAFMEKKEKVPAGMSFAGKDPFFPERARIYLRRTSANVRLTIFEGGHAGNLAAGIDWLARQRRNAPVDWTLPEKGEGGEFRVSR